MANTSTATRTSTIVEQSDRHAKTVSRHLAEQFRAVENPSFDVFKSFARDYVSVCLTPEDNGVATDLLSASDQAELAHALRINLPADAVAETKSFDDFVMQLYALY